MASCEIAAWMSCPASGRASVGAGIVSSADNDVGTIIDDNPDIIVWTDFQ